SQPVGEEDADDAPDGGEQGGLDQELQQDIALPGAHGLARPDLDGPFGDGDQHDVHDHDPPHHERDQGYGRHHHGDGARELPDHVLNGAAGEDVEVVLAAGPEL